jgi:ribosomal protein S18 acetylase RimI-like enzyme
LSIIKHGRQPVGRLYTVEFADEIRIIDITILPEHRSQGIGTKLVKDILQTGVNTRKVVQIYVENFNPSSRLFSRLGFIPAFGLEVHVLWLWENGRTK